MSYEDRLKQLLAEEARMSYRYLVIVLKPRVCGSISYRLCITRGTGLITISCPYAAYGHNQFRKAQIKCLHFHTQHLWEQQLTTFRHGHWHLYFPTAGVGLSSIRSRKCVYHWLILENPPDEDDDGERLLRAWMNDRARGVYYQRNRSNAFCNKIALIFLDKNRLNVTADH